MTLAAAVCSVVLLVFDVAVSRTAAVIVAACVLALFVTLWLVMPLVSVRGTSEST